MKRRIGLADAAFWLLVFALGMALQSLTRLALFLLHAPEPEQGGSWDLAAGAFVRGLRFDAAGLAYPFALAVLVAWAAAWIGSARLGKSCRRPDVVCGAALVAWTAWLGVTELHFFREFRSRLNFIAIEYLGEGETTLRMVVETLGVGMFVASIAGFAVVAAACAWGVARMHRRCRRDLPGEPTASHVARLALLVAAFLAMRGGFDRPIRPQDADDSPHRFVNQLTLSGLFTLERHVYELWKDSRHGDLDADYGIGHTEAVRIARGMFGLPDDVFVDGEHPALRTSPRGEPRRMNVLMIVLESFAARYVGALAAPEGESYTPRFDERAKTGVLFTRFLANGPSTNRSLPALLAGFPCLVKRTAITKAIAGQEEFLTFGRILAGDGYETAFLGSGEASWQNLGGWCRAQGFHHLIGRDDFPADTWWSVRGPPDHVLLGKTLEVCNELARSGPFATVVLTSTNHPPFAVPEDIPDGIRAEIDAEPEGPHLGRRRALRYADWAVDTFLEDLSARPWAKDTLIVLVGDHGVHFAPAAEIDPDRRHVPLLLIGGAPELRPRRAETLGSHVDLVPTILGVLGSDRPHASWGRDLLVESAAPRYAVLGPHGGLRAYAIARDDGRYLVDRLDGPPALFDVDFTALRVTPVTDAPDDVADLRRLGRAYMQAAHRAFLERRIGR